LQWYTPCLPAPEGKPDRAGCRPPCERGPRPSSHEHPTMYGKSDGRNHSTWQKDAMVTQHKDDRGALRTRAYAKGDIHAAISGTAREICTCVSPQWVTVRCPFDVLAFSPQHGLTHMAPYRWGHGPRRLPGAPRQLPSLPSFFSMSCPDPAPRAGQVK